MRVKHLLLWIPVWLSACSSKSESAVKEEKQKQEDWRKPPPPPDGIWNRVDSIARYEKGYVYPDFALMRTLDYPEQKLPCCLRFRSFFYDIASIGIRAQKDRNVFAFSSFNNPMHFDKKNGKMKDIFYDDEWQDNIFFQIPVGHRHFHYVDEQLTQVKLTDATSAFAAMDNPNSNDFRIRKGVLEGWQLNDTTWHVKLKASYQVDDQDSTRIIGLKIDQRFHIAKPDTSIWKYSCHELE